MKSDEFVSLQSGIDTASAKWILNPFCEIAVEEAVRLKERSVASEVTAVTVGPKQAQDQLRTALALGADKGIHVITDAELQPLAVAKLLAEISQREQPALILLGKQAVDGDNNQTGQMLGGLLKWPQATFASKLTVNATAGQAEVTREVDGGLETLAVKLPAVVTTDLRLNEPRYATLPNIMKAKRKAILPMTTEELGVDVRPQLTTLQVDLPRSRRAGVLVSSVAELVDKLRNEVKVI